MRVCPIYLTSIAEPKTPMRPRENVQMENGTHSPIRVLLRNKLAYSSSNARCARRMAFDFFIRFSVDGLVKYVRFLNSFKTPERSYFFLKRRMALSIDSFSWITMPTNPFTSFHTGESPTDVPEIVWSAGRSILKFSTSCRSPSFWNATIIALLPFDIRALLNTRPTSFHLL